ncbi:hypothetical protein UA01_00077 [Streptococcus parasanguinis]|jgi:hypothetical protein|uniref:Uncharacterized protein n=1 Tax=Streptococcus parasanguinis FW213 TaxID=1114965 RepID=I1ZJX8_STRPA|nr:HEPN domain-containing protein [Streptococcus parasanguinis]AFJ25352.1 hypothetical protein Spaf_0333 [Streptococcus parasanguinis FW213]KJU99616.1 hypothetical protein UA01_00077 [Streptococcus parasanguinis]
MSKLTYKSYSWDKNFEIKGYFSDNKSKVVSSEANSGILTYSPNEIVLEIFGEFPNDEAISINFGDPVDKIYGFDSSGNLLILESYGGPYGTDNSPGFPMKKYRIKNFKIFEINYQWLPNKNNFKDLIVELIDELDDTKVQYYQFSFDHLEDWIGKPIISTERDFEQKDFNIEVNISDYPPTEVLITSEDLKFKDVPSYIFSYDALSVEPSYRIRLSSPTDRKVSLQKCYKASRRIMQLVEMLSEKSLSFLTIEFLCKKRQDNNWPIIKGKYFVQHSRKNIKWDKHELHKISLNKLGDNFEAIINNWFDKSEQLEFIVRSFTANLHGAPYLEDSFIDSIRNLEVFARNFRGEQRADISKEEDINKQRVFDFINKNIDERFKNIFRNRLKYQRQDSDLRKKLLDLFTNVPGKIGKNKLTDASISSIVKKLYDSRNYYIHGDEKSKYKNLVTDFNEMYELRTLCQEVLRFYIFQELGLEYDEGY